MSKTNSSSVEAKSSAEFVCPLISTPIVGLPDTPSPLVTVIPSSAAAADAVIVLDAYVSAAVRVIRPLTVIAFGISKSSTTSVNVYFRAIVVAESAESLTMIKSPRASVAAPVVKSIGVVLNVTSSGVLEAIVVIPPFAAPISATVSVVLSATAEPVSPVIVSNRFCPAPAEPVIVSMSPAIAVVTVPAPTTARESAGMSAVVLPASDVNVAQKSKPAGPLK